MTSIQFPMHQTDNALVRLADVLALIPSNDWFWRVTEFYGVGLAPGGSTMPEFEQVVGQTPLGYAITWPELVEFAADLDQVFDCEIRAYGQVPRDLSELPLVNIEAFDSTQWSISIHREVDSASLIIAALSSRFGGAVSSYEE